MWANNVKIFAASAVVFLHVSSGFVANVDVLDPSYAGSNWWAGNIFDSITRWCVPVFLIISGYFLLNKQESLTAFLHKRISRILIPILFWSAFYTLWALLAAHFKGHLNGAIESIIPNLIIGCPYYHLWYLFMLPMLYLVTPYLRILLYNAEKTSMVLLVCICLGLSASVYLYNSLMGVIVEKSIFLTIFIPYLGYFLLGGVLNRFDIKVSNKVCIALLALSWLVTIIGNWQVPNSYFFSNFSINTIVASFCIFMLIKQNIDRDIKLNFIATYSFGIYLIHPIFRDIFSFLLKDKLLELMHSGLYIVLVSLVIILLSYFACEAMSRIRYLRNCI